MRRLLPVALAIVLPVAACASDDGETTSPMNGGADAETEQENVTLVLDWTPNTNHTGIYVAAANDWYAEEGLDVDIIQPGEGGSLQALGSGQADFAVTVQEDLIPARAAGVEAVSVAAVIQHNTSSLASLADTGIEGPADLAGHRYGGFGGLLERALVTELVTCAGGDADEVEFVEVGNVDYRVGLERGDYDFVWIFDGWDGIRLDELEEVDLSTIPFVEHTDCIPDWYTPVIATNETLIADDPDTVRAFMAATARGYEYAIEQPDEAAELLLDQAPELDPELVTASARYLADQYAADAGRWGEQDEQVWLGFEAFLRESGLVEDPIDVDEAYTNDFLPPG